LDKYPLFALNTRMPGDISAYQRFFFIGVAGSGMSALAQYLSGIGKTVSGSDRYFSSNVANETRDKLEAAGVHCYPQNGEGIQPGLDLIVASTAVEDTVPEVAKARSLGIPIIKRAELLAMIAASKRTIAVGGTSGKSTTSAMLFDIMTLAGFSPSIISGAGLISLIKKDTIGNAFVGTGEWLIIEADESDGSIVLYEPEIGLLLNIDKDHQEIDELMQIFAKFRSNTTGTFIVNRSNALAASLSVNAKDDFGVDTKTGAGWIADHFEQEGLLLRFEIQETPFHLHALGTHNMENALAAVAVAASVGIGLETCSQALSHYEGIFRRHQVLGQKHGVWVIDDFAHNPVKCARSIQACQPLAPKVVAWFQPHGYGPTRFLRNDFVKEISAVMRPEDEIWMSEIFYAGGTATKDISAGDLIEDIKSMGRQAYFVADRNTLVEHLRPHLEAPCVLLLMGARDPSLEQFANDIFATL
jgi:UDP-N-acetylmuramate--alanine ligase